MASNGLPSYADMRRKLEEPTFTATPKQVELFNVVFSGNYLYIAMGGGIRGTKTWGMISVLIALCRMYPGSRWAVVRKDLPTLRRNTIPSINKLKDLCGGFVDDLNQSTWTYRCSNGSEILLFPESVSTDPDYDRWKGLEVNGFLLEEANEMTEGAANKAIERAGSWIIPGNRKNRSPAQPPPFVFFTFNPCSNWPYWWFYEPHKAGNLTAPFFYLPSTAADNPYIPHAVREAWKNLPDKDYRRFVLGEWEFLDDPEQLIPTEWVLEARNREFEPGPARIGVDPSREGDDEAVVCRTNGNTLIGFMTFPRMKTTRLGRIVAREAIDPRMPVKDKDIRVDDVGLGAGTTDALDDEGFRNVTRCIGGAPPWRRKDKSFYRFKNFRSQMWWEIRVKFQNGELSLPDEIPPRLLADLTSIHYKISSDRVVEVEEKRLTKKRIGRSPDWGDAYCLAVVDEAEQVAPDRQVPPTTSRRSLR